MIFKPHSLSSHSWIAGGDSTVHSLDNHSWTAEPALAEDKDAFVTSLETAIAQVSDLLTSAEAGVLEHSEFTAALDAAVEQVETQLASTLAAISDPSTLTAAAQAATQVDETSLADAETAVQHVLDKVSTARAAIRQIQEPTASTDAAIATAQTSLGDMKAAVQARSDLFADTEAAIVAPIDALSDTLAAVKGDEEAQAQVDAAVRTAESALASMETAITVRRFAVLQSVMEAAVSDLIEPTADAEGAVKATEEALSSMRAAIDDHAHLFGDLSTALQAQVETASDTVAAVTHELLDSDFILSWSLDDISDGVADDLSGNELSGDVSGSPSNVSGVSGNGVSFSSNDTITVDHHLDLKASEEFSYSVWLRTTGWNNSVLSVNYRTDDHRGVDLWDGGGGEELAVHILHSWSDDAIKVHQDSGSSGYINAQDGDWHHVVTTYDGSKAASGVQIFVDGQEQPLSVQVNNLSSEDIGVLAPIRLNGRSDSDGNQQQSGSGDLDEFQVWTRKLTPPEADTLYRNPGHRPGTAQARAAIDTVRTVGASMETAITVRRFAVLQSVMEAAVSDLIEPTVSAEGGVTAFETLLANTRAAIMDTIVQTATGHSAVADTDDVTSSALAAVGDQETDHLAQARAAISEQVSGDWLGYEEVVAQGAKVAAPVNDLAIALENMSSEWWNNVASDGSDIRVRDATGTTDYAFELEAFDYANQTGILWFRAQGLQAGSDTTYRVYAGNSNATTPAPSDPLGSQNVWPSSAKGVWHLGRSSGNALDSTSNGNDGTVNGATQGVSGQVGNAYSFDGNDDTVEVSDDAALDPDRVTIFLWFKPNNLPFPGWDGLVSKGPSGTREYWIYGVDGASEIKTEITTSDGGGSARTPSLTEGEWAHIALVYDGNQMLLYQDASEVGGNTLSGDITPTTNPLYVGHIDGFGYFDGQIDEVRVYNRALSADEISTYFNNQSDQGAFWSFNGWHPAPSAKAQAAIADTDSVQSAINAAASDLLEPTGSARAAIHDIEDFAAQAEGAVTTDESHSASAQAAIDRTHVRLASVAAAVGDLETLLADTQAAIVDTIVRTATTHSAVADTEEVVSAALAAVGDQESRLASLQAAISDTSTPTAQAEAAVQDQHQRVAGVQAAVREVFVKAVDTVAAVSNVLARQADVDAAIRQVQTFTATLDAAVADVAQRMSDAQTAIATDESPLASVDAAVRSAEDALAQARVAVSDIRESLGQAEAAVSDLETATAQADAAVSDLGTQTASVDTAVTEVETLVSQAQAAITSGQGVSADVQSALMKAERQLAASEAAIAHPNLDQHGSTEAAVTVRRFAILSSEAKVATKRDHERRAKAFSAIAGAVDAAAQISAVVFAPHKIDSKLAIEVLQTRGAISTEGLNLSLSVQKGQSTMTTEQTGLGITVT